MRFFSSVIVLIILLSSCADRPATQAPLLAVSNPQEKQDNLIKFTVNGKEVVTAGWTISRVHWSFDPTKEWLNITTDMHKEKRTIGVNLAGSVAGVYTLEEGGSFKKKSHGDYKPDYADFLNGYSFISGEFNLTEIDTVRNIVNGSFYGTVINTKGETLTISNGQIINGKLKPGVTQL